MAYSVVDSARNAWSVVMQNGPHVIWGRGLACPDGIVYDLMIDGTLPAAREQQCRQDLVDDYFRLTLTDPAQMADPVNVARSVDTELYNSIALGGWDGGDTMTVGCDYGGTVQIIASADSETTYKLQDCRFWPDLSVTGTGIETNHGDDGDKMIIAFQATGSHGGDIIYTYSIAHEAWSIEGTWDNQPAILPRSDP
jgi:hypothetical protein